MSATRERRTLPLPPALAERLLRVSRHEVAQRLVLEAAIERAVAVDSVRLQKAWDEHVRKQALRMGWRW